MFRKNINNRKLSARRLMGITLAAFLGLSLVSTAVYLISGYITDPAAAFFESVSAISTTGASIFKDTSSLPLWLLIFRSFSQWIGGGATLVFLACLVSNMDSSEGGLSRSDDASGALYRTGIRFTAIARRLLLTYVIMTVVEAVLLFICGFTAPASICLSLSTMSTGGMLPAGAFPSGMGETVIVIFMMLTCINYTLYYHAIKKHFDKFDKNTELYALLWIIIGASVIITADLAISGTYDLRQSVEYGIFHTVSSLTTTGFKLADLSTWPSFSKILITVLSFIGGSSCSVGSGIKLMRLVIVLRIISKSFTIRIHPRAVVSTKLNGRSLHTTASSAIANFFLTYFAVYLLGVFVIAFESEDVVSCFTVSAALLNNVGIAIDSTIDYALVSPVMQVLMSVLMLAGRLELYTVMLPFSRNDRF